jgi:hypothetical protein
MKKLLMIMAFALALAVTSCIEHHVVLTLNKDGSGTITEETTLGGAVVAMMAGIPGADGDANPLAEMTDESKVKEQAATMGEGVTVQTVEEVDANGRKGGKITYAFKDINKLKYSFGGTLNDMSEGMGGLGGAEEGEADEAKPLNLSYRDGVLTLKNDAVADAGAKEEEPAEEMDEAGIAMAKQMMGDMKMSFKLEFPGGIAESNATHVDGNTVTMMEMEMGKLLEDPEKFKKLNQAKPETAAEMQEALKGIEGVKVEIRDEVTIKLK